MTGETYISHSDFLLMEKKPKRKPKKKPVEYDNQEFNWLFDDKKK